MKLNRSAIFYSVNIMFVFAMFTPMYIWGEALLLQVFFYISAICSIFVIKDVRVRFNGSVLLFVLWVMYVVAVSVAMEVDSKKLLVFLVLMLFSLYMLLLDESKLVTLFDIFYNVVFIFALLALLTWLLIALDVVSLHSMYLLDSYEPIKRENGVFYYTNFVSNWMPQTNYCVSSFCASRLMGPLNEPGYWGTLVAMVLAIKEMKPTFRNVIIFISGVLTLSLAFFIMVFMYLLITLVRQKKLTLLVIFFSLFMFYSMGLFDGIIGYRLMGGSGVRDNRNSDLFLENFFVYLNDPLVFFGNGAFSSSDILNGSSSFLSVLYDVGIFGLVIFVMFHLSFIDKSFFKRRFILHAVGFICIFSLSLYQRPYLLTPQYLFVYLSFVYSLRRKNEAKS